MYVQSFSASPFSFTVHLQFSPRHSQSRTIVLTAACAASLLINGRSAHLIASRQILMQA